MEIRHLLIILLCCYISIIFLRIIHILVYRENSRQKGVFTITLFIVASFFLYVIGFYYQYGVVNGESYLKSVTYATELLVFKEKTSDVIVAYQTNSLYAFVYNLAFGVGVLITASLTIQIFARKMLNSAILMVLSKFSNVVVIGKNEQTKEFMKQYKNKFIVWVDNKEDQNELLNQKIVTYYAPYQEKSFRKFKSSKKTNFIAFLEDAKHLTLINEFNKFQSYQNGIAKYPNKTLFVHMEANYSHIYDELMEKSAKQVRIFNSYEMLARHFLFTHPISKYISEEYLDRKRGVIVKGVINMIMVGYGKVNQKIHNQSVYNQQFVKLDSKDNLKAQDINYYLFDRNQNQLNMDLKAFRQYNPKNYRSDEYFEMANKNVFIKEHFGIDINSHKFLDEVFSIIKEDGYHAILVSFDSDQANTDLSILLIEKIKQWRIKSQVQIFVRIRNENLLLVENVKNYFEQGLLTIYGTTSLYMNKETIFDEKLDELAIIRAFNYEISSSNLSVKDTKEAMLENWRSLSYALQQSNRYSACSIQSKLCMFGYQLDASTTSINKEEFLLAYDPTKSIRYCEDGSINYDDIDKLKDISPRYVLAYIEHLRWNALHIFNGFIPLRKSLIYWQTPTEDEAKQRKKGKLINKDIYTKEHSCLTTFEGLKSYHEFAAKIVLENNICDCMEDALKMVNVIKYDYMLIDTLYDDINGFQKKIIKL